jgi:hypothetical protein
MIAWLINEIGLDIARDLPPKKASREVLKMNVYFSIAIWVEN